MTVSARAAARRLKWTDDNDIQLLCNGVAFFPALCAAIDAAQESVHLETYMFELDEVGETVLAALARAAERGVRIRVVLDGFGCAQSAPVIETRVAAMGGQFRVYRPEPKHLGWLVPSRRRLRRLHRKITTVDGKIAFVGGINIIDDFNTGEPPEPGAPRGKPRYDYSLRVCGGLVAHAVHAQDLLWVRMNLARLRRHPAEWRTLRLTPPATPQGDPCGTTRAALMLRDNVRHRKTIEAAYLRAIASAKREIVIANAYFFPGREFREALSRAVARGVRVRLLLQGKVEYRMQYHATRALYDELLRAGLEIHEYMPSHLHAKVAVIDDWATVGSSNLDPFSLLLAREANVLVDDPAFARNLLASLEKTMASGGQRVELRTYGKRGWLHRLVDAASHVMLRIGVALTGKGTEY